MLLHSFNFLCLQVLEINTTHPIIKSIHHLRSEDEDLARAMAEQVSAACFS